MSAYGFKEWSLICDSLGTGRQSVILRKGGIAEGRAGFRWQHEEFYLFPTVFHGQTGKIRPEELPPGLDPDAPAPERPAIVDIHWFARAERVETLTDIDAALRLRPFHIWTDEVVRERFAYDEKQEITLAILRVFRLTEPWSFPDAKAYAGCRSWVSLPDLASLPAMEPVLTDAEHALRRAEIARALE